MVKKRSSDKKEKKQSIPDIPAPRRGRGRPKGSKNKSHKHVKRKKIKVVKPVKEPKIINTGYRQYLSELSKYTKEHGIKLHGRGSFLKRGSEIWVDLKGKPDVIQNLDVLLPNYFQTEDESFKDKYGFTPEEFETFIEVNGYTDFKWWDAHRELEKLLLTEYWKEGFVLRITDENGDFRECYFFTDFERKVYEIIKQDFRAGRTDSQLNCPTLEFDKIYINDEGKTIVNYIVSQWDFSHVEDTQAEIDKVNKEYEEKKKGQKNAYVKKKFDFDLEKENIASKERMESDKTKQILSLYEKLLKEGTINIEQFNEYIKAFYYGK
jgi:hypothetical protein